MAILALETATRRGSLAWFADGPTASMSGDAGRTHGERLPGELLAWLASLGRSLHDVDVFAVVSGPGSFTGLRVGMAAIQGLALAGGKRVIAIPTLEAMASGWIEHDGWTPALVVACFDGQRGEVFVAAWDATERQPIESCPVVVAPEVVRPAEAASAIAARWSGPVVIVGEGIDRYADVFRAQFPNARLISPLEPIAASAVVLASRRLRQATAPHALKPIYLRRPDAELARARAQSDAASAALAASPPFTIALASKPEDLGAVEALQHRSFTNAWGAESIKWELENTDVARLYVMREPGGRLVAYCACWMIFDELHINSLAVDIEWRRRGLARLLLNHVMRDAVRAGARGATLEVRQSNDAARALYEGLGFTVEAVRRDYYQDPREDALILWNRRINDQFSEGSSVRA
jgi:tRNA threonylcarbamoyl adenosine modification protein YeaZ/ribosomal-protein-alanine acetyltransferase